jgi:hypothetical protein
MTTRRPPNATHAHSGCWIVSALCNKLIRPLRPISRRHTGHSHTGAGACCDTVGGRVPAPPAYALPMPERSGQPELTNPGSHPGCQRLPIQLSASVLPATSPSVTQACAGARTSRSAMCCQQRQAPPLANFSGRCPPLPNSAAGVPPCQFQRQVSPLANSGRCPPLQEAPPGSGAGALHQWPPGGGGSAAG